MQNVFQSAVGLAIFDRVFFSRESGQNINYRAKVLAGGMHQNAEVATFGYAAATREGKSRSK
jgi:hypothetical protein